MASFFSCHSLLNARRVAVETIATSRPLNAIGSASANISRGIEGSRLVSSKLNTISSDRMTMDSKLSGVQYMDINVNPTVCRIVYIPIFTVTVSDGGWPEAVGVSAAFVRACEISAPSFE